jgi:membrane associated rhomboid family serine protease
MTRALIWANVIVFGIEFLLPERTLQNAFYLFGVVPFRFTHPGIAEAYGFPENQYWSLLTSMFLHGGFFHLLSNMWTLWIFGDNVEDKMGPFRFLLFYVVCGVAAMLLHTLTNWGSTVPTIGASGAIAGVLGAYFVLFPKSVVLTFVPIFFFIPILPIPAVIFLFFWFFSQFFNGALAMVSSDGGGGIAWWAHIGGFLAGMFFYKYFLSKKRPAS